MQVVRSLFDIYTQRNNMKGWNITNALMYGGLLLTLLPMLAVYIFGAVNYLVDLEDNNCEMTYMFEYPQYVVIF